MDNSVIETTIAKTVSHDQDKKIASFLPVIVCTLAGLFYLYEFVLQVSPSVMTTELMRDLKLNAAGLGAVSAFYYYAYTPMQIPAGLLYDRFGPRILITIAILICASGAFFFGLTNNVAMASLGRFFMGIGSAFSFIGALVLVAHWFPPRYFALLAGIVQLMSSVGAIVGQAPLAKVVENFGWRHTIMCVSLIGIGLSALVWWIVRDRPDGQTTRAAQSNSNRGELKRLKHVCGKSQTWWLGLYSFTSWAPITAFAALWGVPYLVSLYGISTAQASSACSMIWLGIGLGSPFIGWVSDKLGRRCAPLSAASAIGIVALTSILYFSTLPLGVMYVFLFFLGVAATGQSLSFGLVKDMNPNSVVGTAIGFNNMTVVAGGALFQPLVGILLQMHWAGQTVSGAPVYTLSDYRVAMSILPVCYVVGLIVSLWFLKETYCQPLHEQDN